MILTKDTLLWACAGGLGAAFYAFLLAGPIVAIVLFMLGALMGAWVEQSRFDAYR